MGKKTRITEDKTVILGSWSFPDGLQGCSGEVWPSGRLFYAGAQLQTIYSFRKMHNTLKNNFKYETLHNFDQSATHALT